MQFVESCAFGSQILTVLDVVIPLSQLFTMFNDGVRVMRGNSKDDKPARTHKYEDGGRRGSPGG
jgi:hypothetical protein